uniref:MATH domain-containing protein n=1 Tax=Amphimedon queenslandica TaxID=400682 RepID=A0A1X7T6X8_AMPQE
MEEMDHKSVCSKYPIECIFKDFGCHKNPIKEDYEKHMNENVHTHLSMLVMRFKNNQYVYHSLDLKQPMVCKYDELLHSNPSFLIHVYTASGYHMMVDVAIYHESYEKYLSIYIKLIAEDYDHVIDYPCANLFTIEILNQLEDNNHIYRRLSLPEPFNLITPLSMQQRYISSEELAYKNPPYIDEVQCDNTPCYGIRRFISLDELTFSTQEKKQYIMDNKMFIRIRSQNKIKNPWVLSDHIVSPQLSLPEYSYP